MTLGQVWVSAVCMSHTHTQTAVGNPIPPNGDGRVPPILTRRPFMLELASFRITDRHLWMKKTFLCSSTRFHSTSSGHSFCFDHWLSSRLAKQDRMLNKLILIDPLFFFLLFSQEKDNSSKKTRRRKVKLNSVPEKVSFQQVKDSLREYEESLCQRPTETIKNMGRNADQDRPQASFKSDE